MSNNSLPLRAENFSDRYVDVYTITRATYLTRIGTAGTLHVVAIDRMQERLIETRPVNRVCPAHQSEWTTPILSPAGFDTSLAQLQPADKPAAEISSLRYGKLKLHAIASLFVVVTLSWLLVFTHNSNAQTNRINDAAAIVAQANQAWQKGNSAQADRLFAKAYAIYSTSTYSPCDLSRICSLRAQLNMQLGNAAVADQMALQAREFITSEHQSSIASQQSSI